MKSKTKEEKKVKVTIELNKDDISFLKYIRYNYEESIGGGLILNVESHEPGANNLILNLVDCFKDVVEDF